MNLTYDFSGYQVPSYDFAITPYQYTPDPQMETRSIVYPVPTIAPVVSISPIAKKTISFTVKDDKGGIPLANIAVDGVDTAVTDEIGRVTLPNISQNAVIKVSYMGFENYVAAASSIPSVVVLKEGTILLNEVKIINDYKKPATSNTWLWVLAAAAFGIYKYSKTGVKVVKAKI